MKKRKLNKLALNKRRISDLNASMLYAGEAVDAAAPPTYQPILCVTNTSRICPSEEYCLTSKGAVVCVGLISACGPCPDPIDPIGTI